MHPTWLLRVITFATNCLAQLLSRSLNVARMRFTPATFIVHRARWEPGGTRWRTGGEVKGKLANGVGSQYNTTLPRNVVCPALLPLLLLIRTPRLPVVDWSDAPTDLNGFVLFGERRNLVSARVPSRSARAIQQQVSCSCPRSSGSTLRSTWAVVLIMLHRELEQRLPNRRETVNCRKVYIFCKEFPQ